MAWRLGLVALLLMPFDETWLAFWIAWLQVGGEWSGSAAALAGGVAVAGAAAGFGPVAALARHRSDRAVVTLATLTAAASGAVVGILPPATSIVAGFVLNAAIAVAWVTLQRAVLVLRPGSEARVTAFVSGIEHTAIALALGLGVIADAAGLRSVFVGFAIVGIVASALATTLPRPDRVRSRSTGRR